MILPALDESTERKLKPSLSSVELFAGTGGLSLGIHAAGFNHGLLVENNAFAIETLRDNSKRLLNIEPQNIVEADVAKVDFSSFHGNLDLLAGGPPCQPFSMAGKSFGQNDSRNMFPMFLDLVGNVLPKAILVENVKGILRRKFEDYFRYIILRMTYPLFRPLPGEEWNSHYDRLLKVKDSDFLNCETYNVIYQLVDAADFGIPQRRERVIISAYRRDLGIVPVRLIPTHSKEALFVDQVITGNYWKSRGLLPGQSGFSSDSKVRIKDGSLFDLSKPWRTVRDAIGDLPPSVPRGESPRFPNHVQHPGARIYECHTGSYLDLPAKALKAGTHGTPGGENMLRISGGGVRYFTTREAARIQTFPDDWLFHGTWGACIRQLGNAVPVDLARQFAAVIYDNLTSGTSKAG